MTPFKGFLFTPIIETIIEHGAVSGGCFPSSHVAASWGVVFALARVRRKHALVLGFFAVGMSFACVYTRYHHGVDAAAGFRLGLAGAFTAGLFERSGEDSQAGNRTPKAKLRRLNRMSSSVSMSKNLKSASTRELVPMLPH